MADMKLIKFLIIFVFIFSHDLQASKLRTDVLELSTCEIDISRNYTASTAVALNYLAYPGIGQMILGDYAAGMGFVFSKFYLFPILAQKIHSSNPARQQETSLDCATPIKLPSYLSAYVAYSGKFDFDFDINLSVVPIVVGSVSLLLLTDCVLESIARPEFEFSQSIYTKAFVLAISTWDRTIVSDAFDGITVGLGEELFFRGTLQPLFSDLLENTASGHAISSVAFAFIHWGNADVLYPNPSESYARARWRLLYIPFHFMSGMYISWLKESTGSIFTGILIHCLYDFAAFRMNRFM